MNNTADSVNLKAYVHILSSASAFQRLDFPLEAREVHQYFEFGPHSHSGFMEIVLVTGGKATHIIGENRRQIGVGDLLVIPEGIVHNYEDLADLRYFNILFDPCKLDLPLDELALVPGSAIFDQTEHKEGGFCHLSGADFAAAHTLALELNSMIAQKLPGVEFSARARLMMLLDLLCRCSACAQTSSPLRQTPHRLDNLILEMGKRFQKNWTIGEMCRITNLSRPILFREFRKIFDCTPMEYLLNIRMRHACRMLTDSALNISEIAQRCGFRDSSYFSCCFRRRTAMTPGEFRHQSREQ